MEEFPSHHNRPVIVHYYYHVQLPAESYLGRVWTWHDDGGESTTISRWDLPSTVLPPARNLSCGFSWAPHMIWAIKLIKIENISFLLGALFISKENLLVNYIFIAHMSFYFTHVISLPVWVGSQII